MPDDREPLTITVSDEKLNELIVLKTAQLKTSKMAYNIGEPWNSVEKFMDDNIVDLLRELLDYRNQND